MSRHRWLRDSTRRSDLPPYLRVQFRAIDKLPSCGDVLFSIFFGRVHKPVPVRSQRRTHENSPCRAMIASQPIKKGDRLVNVPRNLWMTSETAKTSPLCGGIVQQQKLDSWKVTLPPPMPLFVSCTSVLSVCWQDSAVRVFDTVLSTAFPDLAASVAGLYPCFLPAGPYPLCITVTVNPV